FYLGLKALGVTTELVTYPNEPHVFMGEAHRIDVLRRVVEWFDTYTHRDAGRAFSSQRS
ncbi:MAG: hypothetical protein IMZ67_07055, partial [Acidobacteria bacterium]|nr:hypothetical protein [Acidobacteriota bacterium]